MLPINVPNYDEVHLQASAVFSSIHEPKVEGGIFLINFYAAGLLRNYHIC